MAKILAIMGGLLIQVSHSAYNVKCNHTAISNGFFNVITRPIRSIAAKSLHRHPCLEHLDGSGILHVAAWPTYANETHLHLSGYTYALSECADVLDLRHDLFERVVSLAGGRALDDQGHMPPDYLSFSVSGATITFSFVQGSVNLTSGVTGEYGHYEALERHTKARGIWKMEVSTAECPLNDSLRPLPTQTTVQVLPPRGVTIVSDVDDVLRETEVWNFKQMILNTFARPFKPWSEENTPLEQAFGNYTRTSGQPLGSMPSLYHNWHSALNHTHGNIHFHYVSDAPEMSHEFYVRGITQHYPAGSFDFRPMVFDTFRQATQSRYDNIRRLIETFPQRRFVLVGDTATPAMLGAYRKIAAEFPHVQCMLLRDVRATQPANWFANDLSALPRGRFLVFDAPHELDANGGMDIATLLQTLSETGDFRTGCGGLVGRDKRGVDYGKMAWAKSASRGIERYFACWLLTWGGRRPSRDCWFDRRGLLKDEPVTEEG